MSGTDPALPIQKALVDAIKAIPTVCGNNVFDTVPTSNPYPRVTIGIGQSIPDPSDCRDGTESFVQIDAWSRAVGYPEVKTIADQIRGRLHDGELAIAGHGLDLMELRISNADRDPDGLTSRVRMLVRLLTAPET